MRESRPAADPPEAVRLQRVRELFDQVRGLEADNRATALDDACADDPELRREVETLLDVFDSDLERLRGSTPGEALRSAVEQEDNGEPGVPSMPDRIGPFRLIGVLGEGGMAVVFEAEQERTRRRVALKVPRHGVLSENARKRFLREAKFLGRLRHPGVAQVVDAGVAESGQGVPLPWIALELISGTPLTEYAQQHARALRDRVALLIQVADAAAHAHDAGIVHRDLKPSNVLVDDDGRVRVLDFGVSRLTDDELESSLLTRTGDVIGTLAYMSPEQAAGRPADARSDVYSLGVLAFEVLTGQLPRDLADLSLPQALAVILDDDARRLHSVDRRLPRDLDVIAGKALARDPGRRYAAASDLAADLRRWLSREPIAARSPGIGYRLRRFVQRHAVLTAATCGLFAVLSATTLYSVLQARTTERALYRMHMGEAVEALDRRDTASARAELERAPARWRGWEWQHLRSRVDDAAGRAQVAGSTTNLLWLDGETLLAQSGREIGWWRWDGTAFETEGSHQVTRLGDTIGAVSSDGRFALIATDTRPGFWSAELVDLRNGRRLQLGEEFPRPVLHTYFGFSPDARLALVHVDRAADERELRLFATEDGASRLTWPISVGRSTWGPNAAWRIVPNPVPHGVAQVLDIERGESLGEVPGLASPSGLTLSPDGKTLAAASLENPGWITLWAISGHEFEQRWSMAPEGADRTTALIESVFNPSATRLAVVADNGRAWLLDTADGATLAATPVIGSSLTKPTFTPDGETLAVAGPNATVRLIAARDGRSLGDRIGFERDITGLAIDPGSRWLAAGGDDGQVRVFDLTPPSRGVLSGHRSYVYDLSFHPHGNRFASAAWDGTVRVWSAADGEALQVLDAANQQPYYSRLAYSPDGRWLASIHGETVTLWDATGGTRLHDLSFDAPREDSELARLTRSFPVADILPAQAVAWHPDGSRFAVSCWRRDVHVWQLGPAEPQRTTIPLSASAMTWSRRGELVAWVPDDRWKMEEGRIELWDVEAGRRTQVLTERDGYDHSLRASPDGRLVAAAGDDGRVRVWSLGRGELVAELDADRQRVLGVAFSPDGDRLVAGGDSRVIRVWDTGTWDELVRLTGHESYVHALAFSPDGTLLVSGGGDRTVRMWGASNASTGTEQRRGPPPTRCPPFDGRRPGVIAGPPHSPFECSVLTRSQRSTRKNPD